MTADMSTPTIEPVQASAPAASVRGPVEEHATATGAASLAASAVGGGHLDLLADVELLITVELGRTRRTIRDLLALRPGSVLELDSAAGSPVDLLVNGRLLAHGEVVVVDEQYGVRITEIVGIEAVT